MVFRTAVGIYVLLGTGCALCKSNTEMEYIMDPILAKIQKMINESEHVVVISGLEVVLEAGLNGVRAEQIAYDIEQEYGYSNDEIISSEFFSRRVNTFYDYYKKVILNKELETTPVHQSIFEIQEAGRLDAVITRTVYSLHKLAGCENVIELHGSVEENRCPNCNKSFGSAYIRSAKSVPVCDECEIPLRPGFTLIGEMVDNGKMTKASNAVEKADVLLIVGAGLNSALCRHLLKYYSGNKMVVLNVEKSVGDDKADYQAYGNLSEMMAEITKDLQAVKKPKKESETDKKTGESEKKDKAGKKEENVNKDE